ncbi:class I adenylate-forming enzyme family protein [Pseudomonas asplenii]|uniref:Long-chain-fatty-acid--CoA ligase n=1 Tax=Pseudomonas asplenii TaxID=53407 RepID=A0A0M9GIJ3_9PSED|nr:fatty acid--CoA ligase family protein [Pseudomonas fuscovaginae]KPA92136.1 acyl-CoA synthetase (AMP-forming)/AMP-acid ligase II [Pseudomonas fuscovaginae]KPA97984.1 acyl-CoA synthetase (AMP-forming)/AMP-acid ligase II [Pseudomonas fuscovaginae]
MVLESWFEAVLEGPIVAAVAADRRSAWERQLDELAQRGPRRVLLLLDSTVEHAALMLLVLKRGLSPLLVAGDTPSDELQRYAVRGSTRQVLQLGDGNLLVSDMPDVPDGQAADQPLGLCLMTSGTTGEPSLVIRELSSWRDEGLRYCNLLQLGPDDRVLFVAPIYHAYALGWLWGAILAGAGVEICKPMELGLAQQALRERATHCVLTPMLAGLLAQRAGTGGRCARLKVAMSGAGPVDQVLDSQFEQAFGVGLSRNYGSTESGALFGGVAPLPALSIGFPLPGIRVLDEPPAGEPFVLRTLLENGKVHDTGDIVERTAGGYGVVGRQSSAIRRGERWISPFEIASVIASHVAVIDCTVRAVRSRQVGNDHIFAFVVWSAERAWDEAQLRAHCQQRLGAGKVPDRFERVVSIPRASTGKPLLSRHYRPASNEALASVAQAYKRSQLLLGLWQSGALQLSAQGLNIDQVAQRTGLNASMLASAFDIAAACGLVSESREPLDESPRLEALAPMLDLEVLSAQGYNQPGSLTEVLARGAWQRSFERAGEQPAALREAYQRAVAGPQKRLLAQLAWRSVQRVRAGALRVLDVSATGATYTRVLLERAGLDRAASRVVLLGGLNPPDLDIPVAIDPCLASGKADLFDVIVLDNTLHQAPVAQDLAGLLARLAPGGTLIVDEIFLQDGEAAGVGLDWLTHGGTAYLRLVDLMSALGRLGFIGRELSRRESTIFQCTISFTKEL